MSDKSASVKLIQFSLLIILTFTAIPKGNAQSDSTYQSIVARMDSMERNFKIAKLNIQAAGGDFKTGTSLIISGTAASIVGGIVAGFSYRIKDFEKRNLVSLTGFSLLGVGTVLNISGLAFAIRGSKRLSGQKAVQVNF